MYLQIRGLGSGNRIKYCKAVTDCELYDALPHTVSADPSVKILPNLSHLLVVLPETANNVSTPVKMKTFTVSYLEDDAIVPKMQGIFLFFFISFALI